MKNRKLQMHQTAGRATAAVLALVLALALCAMPGLKIARAKGEALEYTGTVSSEEILGLVEAIRGQAQAEGAPINDPAAEDAQREDGTLMQYSFGELYTRSENPGADAPLSAIILTGENTQGLRGTGIDLHAEDLIAAIYNSNAEVDGSREGALLYFEEAEGETRWGRVERDGQRISAVEYGTMAPTEGGYTMLKVTYQVEYDLVSAIRIDGMDGAADEAAAEELRTTLGGLQEATGYRQVKTSNDGLSLDPMRADDLIIDGKDYRTMKPEDLEGEPEDVVMDNEDGTYLRILSSDAYEAVFTCDAEGQNATLISYTLKDDTKEGPRGVRLGDLFHQDFRRFRNGENETDGTTEVLYGSEGTAPYGMADYTDGTGMTLRYITDTADGRQVMLRLHYENNVLTELMLQTLQ